MTRDELVEEIRQARLEWGDEEDAIDLADVLLTRYSPFEAFTWLGFYDAELDGTPLALLGEGKSRDVFQRARALSNV